jgi:hypothetical protein
VNTSNKIHILIWRTNKSMSDIDWEEPTGGLVMNGERKMSQAGVTFLAPDWPLVKEIAHARYHCGPHEELVIVQVIEARERFVAELLHRHWEKSMAEFVEMMT